MHREDAASFVALLVVIVIVGLLSDLSTAPLNLFHIDIFFFVFFFMLATCQTGSSSNNGIMANGTPAFTLTCYIIDRPGR